LAIATRLLKKKERRDFIDNAFNRFTFNDKEELPIWFRDEEMQHYKKTLPITKEDIQKQKLKFEEINARPIKKVLEAEFRKKRKNKNKLEKVREKANSVADNNELSNHEKAKILQKLYKEADGKTKTKKIYVVGKKFSHTVGGKRKRGAIIKNVDTRMKKDKRAEKSKKRKK
jgi:AdoMet-dependent rRNA methyltransferase SPB1